MKIHTSFNTAADENTYYLENDSHLILVDPGSNWTRIKRHLEDIGKPITAILLTHAHYDHIMSVDLVREHFDHPPVYLSELEADWLGDPMKNLSGWGQADPSQQVVIAPADVFYQLHAEYELDGFHFYAVPTPGHSFGSVSLVFPEEDLVLTGDALFREHVGRQDLPTGNREQLLNSVRTELFTLPRHFTVYPGHGPSSEIGHEIDYNPHFN